MRPVYLILLPLVMAGCIEQKAESRKSGTEDFATYCAACHGASARGDGAAASGLAAKPADLTQLSRRAGGKFPATKVMAKIWGRGAGHDSHAAMPEFASLLDSELVPFDGGDGLQTPTPQRLVAIAKYLESLQK